MPSQPSTLLQLPDGSAAQQCVARQSYSAINPNDFQRQPGEPFSPYERVPSSPHHISLPTQYVAPHVEPGPPQVSFSRPAAHLASSFDRLALLPIFAAIVVLSTQDLYSQRSCSPLLPTEARG